MLHEINVSDEAHSAITKRHFGIRWRDEEHYDLVLNTARLTITACVDAIVQLVRSAAFRENPDARRRLEDLSLEAHVRGALRQNPETARSKVTVVCEGGRVFLGGTLSSASDRTAVTAVVGAVTGVQDVVHRIDTPGHAAVPEGSVPSPFEIRR